mgnify:CR=1 FL=1
MKKLVTYLLILGLGLSTAIGAYAGEGYKHKGWLDQETLDKLPPEKKELVVNALDKAKEESKTQKDDIKAAMENVKTILTAPEFDAAAYKTATEELQTLMTQRFTIFSDAIAEVAPQLTQEERQILADAIKAKYKKHHGKRMYDKSGAKQQLKDSAEQMKKNQPAAEPPAENQ